MSVCYYFLHLLPDYDFIYPMAKSTRKSKFRPPQLHNRLIDLMKFEPWNHVLKTTHHAKFHFDPTMRVVSANTQLTTVTEKTISVVHVSPGSAKTLVKRNGIANHHSIAYSLSNSSAKNYQNRWMCVEVIVCNISVVLDAMYTVSQKSPTLSTCYNFYIHSSIATVFGINVAEKVGNQNILYFPTTHN